MESKKQSPGQRALIIGEVLFDQFPDGRNVLGGAPFNVAWNLCGFGHDPLFVSAVGDDDLGSEIRHKMIRHGLDSQGLQTNGHPTGKVTVAFDDGEPRYEIATEQAFDFLRPELSTVTNQDLAIVYHGSLIWRSHESRQAVVSLRSKIDAPVFIDLNIRRPWFEIDQVNEILVGVESLKLNIDELGELSQQELTSDSAIQSAACELLSQFGMRSLWVTAGAKGAYFFDVNGRNEFASVPPVYQLVDTVGAGDAFSSVVLDGMLRGIQPSQILVNAVQFAARVCEMRGATTEDLSFYKIESCS